MAVVGIFWCHACGISRVLFVVAVGTASLWPMCIHKNPPAKTIHSQSSARNWISLLLPSSRLQVTRTALPGDRRFVHPELMPSSRLECQGRIGQARALAVGRQNQSSLISVRHAWRLTPSGPHWHGTRAHRGPIRCDVRRAWRGAGEETVSAVAMIVGAGSTAAPNEPPADSSTSSTARQTARCRRPDPAPLPRPARSGPSTLLTFQPTGRCRLKV